MKRKPGQWRFLNTEFGNAFFNMAVDEALVTSVKQGDVPPTVRVFGWKPPAISFGYAQRVSREVSPERCLEMGVDVVRRPTGGRAVLHWNELTYSVVCREEDVLLGGSIPESYRKISECLVTGLRQLGADVRFEPGRLPQPSPRGDDVTSPCFSSTAQYEITYDGRKLVGSAQRRMNGMLLQHGSLLLGSEHMQVVDLLPEGRGSARERFRQMLARQTATLEEAIGTLGSGSRDCPAPGFRRTAEAIRSGFARALPLADSEDGLIASELAQAERLVCEKYATDAWNYRDRGEESDTIVRRILPTPAPAP